MSLAPMADLDPKGEGGRSMPGNHRSCPVVRGGAVGARVLWRRLDCLKPNLQEDGSSHPPRKTPGTRAGSAAPKEYSDRKPSELGAMPSEGIPRR
jgi:hypothetical protein